MKTPMTYEQAVSFIRTYRQNHFDRKDLVERSEELPGFGYDFFGCSAVTYPYEIGRYYALSVEIILNHALAYP